MDTLYESVKRLIALVRSNGSKVAILRTIGEVLIALANLLESLDIALDAPTPQSAPSTIEECVDWLERAIEGEQPQGLSPLFVIVLNQLIKLLMEALL